LSDSRHSIDPGRPSLRARKKDETRRALLEAADRLFQQKGYEATTLEEICERTGISLRTFFRYFESKRDLALYENIRNVGRLGEGLSRVKEPADVIDELEALYDLMAIEFENDRRAQDRLKLMFREPALVGRSMLIDIETESRIAHALSGEGHTDAALGHRLTAVSIVGGIRYALAGWVHRGCKGPLRQTIANVFALVRQRDGYPRQMRRPGS